MPKVKRATKAKKNVAAKKITKKPLKKTKVKVARTKKKVLAIPKGYHSVTPYLIVDNAAGAIGFYQKAFGAKLGVKIENGGKVNHAELKIGDAKVMLADECPEWNARGPKAFGGCPISIHLYVKNVDKVVERAVAAGGKLLRPVDNLFYGDRCGCVEDPFGYRWHVSTHVENVSSRELKKRAAKMFDKNKSAHAQ
jgi:PhnB protein